LFILTTKLMHNGRMLQPSFTAFSKTNRRMILLLITSHLVWVSAVVGFWSLGSLLGATTPLWTGVFVLLQLFAAAQLLLPVLLMHPEERSRGFYLFWGGALVLSVWLLNQLSLPGQWQLLLTALKSGLLLLVATVTGAALARYVRRLWEVVPVCIVMTMADFVSWSVGPTSEFARVIEEYYRAPEGPPPIIDMVLVKLAFPGQAGLLPVFGVSDWIMVVFFAIVAARYGVNDNLLGPSGVRLARQGCIGRYLPVSVAALFVATVLAQATGLFIPALPLIAIIMLLWYAVRYLVVRQRNV
jgi:hypothetical protein